MTSLDWILMAIGALSALWGLWRGLVREVLSLAGWVASFVLAQQYAAQAGELLAQQPNLKMPDAKNTVDLEIHPIVAINPDVAKVDIASVIDIGPLELGDEVDGRDLGRSRDRAARERGLEDLGGGGRGGAHRLGVVAGDVGRCRLAPVDGPSAERKLAHGGPVADDDRGAACLALHEGDAEILHAAHSFRVAHKRPARGRIRLRTHESTEGATPQRGQCNRGVVKAWKDRRVEKTGRRDGHRHY